MRIVTLGLLLASWSLFGQVPTAVNGVPAESFAGEQFCFDIDLSNSGGPGFGPYHRLILPPEITLDSATFLGTAVSTTTVGVFPASPGNQLTDPRTGAIVTGPEGHTYISLLLPLGSVVSGGPNITTEICATISTSAVVGTPLDVTVQPVYEFGDTATGDNGPITGVAQTAQVIPTVVRLEKTANVAEGERAPGPAFTYTYTITVNVANGKSVFDLDINDTLPADVQYVGPTSIVGGVGAVVDTEPVGVGGVLRVLCDRVDGTTADDDLTITFPVYIIDTLDETNCVTELQTNTVTLDVEHPDNNALPQLNAQADVTAKHVPIQKGAAPGAGSPGDTITYTLNFQVTEYGVADSMVITDVLPDGMTFDAHQSMNVGGPVVIAPLVTPNGDGTTTIVYDVHAVTGDLGPAETGTIVYTATIDQDFTPAPDPILASDSLTNTVDLAYSLTAGAAGCSDDSAATIGIIPVAISKSIVNLQASYVPGESVIYRLELEVPSGDTEQIIFEDFFPLPVFDVSSLAGAGVNVNFGGGADIDYAPSDTLGLVPTAVTRDVATNSVRIEWPNISSMTTETLAVDITITVEDDPFADNLFLTNLFQASTVNSEIEQSIGVSPVQIHVRAPDLVITKGVASSDNATADATISPSPAVLPVDGDIDSSDAGDTLDFVITVENIGGASAYDVIITDPSISQLTGYVIVSVEDGAGNPIAYRDPADVDAPAPPGLPIPTDLSAGIKLDVSLDPNDENPGGGGAPYTTDTVIITYRSVLDSSVEPREGITTSASVAWASQSGAVVFPSVNDDAIVNIASPDITKAITNVSPEAAGSGLATAGDVITYTLTVTLPEGTTPDLVLEDDLPPGFEYVAASVSVNTAGFSGTVDTGPTVATSGAVATGQTLTLSFDSPTDTLVNSNLPSDNSFTVSYDVLVKDLSANDGLPSVQDKTNDASLSYTGISGSPITDSASIDFAEPNLVITKAMSPAGPGIDAGNTVTVTLTVNNNGTAPAYDIVVTDVLNDDGALFDLTSVLEGTTPGNFSYGYANPTVTYTMTSGSLAIGASVVFTFTANINDGAAPDETFSNVASASGDSQSGVVADERTTSDASNAPEITLDSPTVVKSISSISPGGAPGLMTTGDTVVYQFLVTLPEGTTTDLEFNDTLPPGLEYQAATAALDTTGFNGSAAAIAMVNTGGNIATTGETVQIIMTGATTVTSDNNASNNSFIVTIDALVKDLPANAATSVVQSKTNTVALDFNGYAGPAISDTVSEDFSEPVLALTKTMSPDTGLDAGDTVTITLSLQNTGTAPAHDVVVTDVLNDNGELLFDLTAGSSVAEGVTPGSFVYAYDPDPDANPATEEGEVTYDINGGTIAAGATVVMSFTAVVRDDVLTGSTFQNDASATGDSQTGVVADERSTSDTASDTVTTDQASVGKTLTATSENSTDPGDSNLASNPPVAVGEVLDYSITFTLPEGVTQNVTLIDLIPSGLSYISGTATLERSSTALSTADDPGGVNAAAVNTPTAVTPDEGTPGQLSVALGDVTNTDMVDATSETFSLKLQMTADNIVANSAGTQLANMGRITFDNAASSTIGVNTSAVTVHIAEPTLAVTKTAAPLTVEGGDTVTFTVRVENTATGTNASTAFDGTFADSLPTRYKLSPAPAISSVDTSNTAMGPGDVISGFVGRDLTGTYTALAPGEYFEIVYTAVIDENTSFGEQVVNTFAADGTSLPGAQGTGNATPGAAGDADGERIGTDAVNMADTDNATITLSSPSMAKTTLNHQTRYAIGESAEFRATISVPLGTTTTFIATDTLDAGFDFDPGSLSVNLPAGVTAANTPLTEANAAFFTQTGDVLEFDFGSITASSAGSITIEYTARVENVIGNQNGTSLDNSIELEIDDPLNPGFTTTVGPETTDLPALVGEPNLTMNKSITAGGVNADAGNTVDWEVTLQNTGTTTAFQVDWSDVLPDGLFQIASPALAISGGDVFVNGTATPPVNLDFVVSTTTNTDDTVDLPALQIEAGATLTISFTTTVMNTVTPGQVIDNVTAANYTSLVGGGRDNSTDPGNVDDDDDADLNNYEESASQMLTIGSAITIDKTVDQPTFAIGEEPVYTLRVDLIEGLTPSVSTTDILPSGVTYVSHVIAAGNMGMTFGNASYNTRLGSGQTVQFDFGDVTNPSNGNNADDFFTIAITTKVDNILANQNNVVLRNGEHAESSEVYVEYGAGPTQVDFDNDGGTAGIQGLPITLAEPVLNLSVVANPTDQSLGDVVTYTVTITHDGTSTSDAFDLILDDVLPVGLTYVPGSASLPAIDVTAGGQNLQFRISSLTLASNNTSFTYQATVDLDAVVGVPLTNDLDLVYSSIPGATGAADDGRTGDDGSGGLNDYATNDSADVTPEIAAFIDGHKTVAIVADGGTPGIVDPGDTLEYTIVLTTANPNIVNTVFTDTVPDNTTYVAASLTTNAGTTDDSSAPDLVVNVGPMGPPNTVIITFQVTVDGGTPAGTVISNQGSVDSDDTVPEPTDADGDDANGDQPTDVVVGGPPDVENGLYVQKIVEWQTDTDASGGITATDVMRYVFFIQNVGAEELTNVSLTDVIPNGLTPVGASEAITGGHSITVIGQDLTVAIASIPIKGVVTASVEVTIDDPLVDFDADPNFETFINQALAGSDQTDPTLSDSNGDPNDGNQPTSFTAADDLVSVSPNIDVEKRWMLAVDFDGDGLVDPNDILEYNLTIINNGSGPATNARLADTLSADLDIVPGSVGTSQGVVVNESPIDINLGQIDPGDVVTVVFRATVDGATPDGTIIPNQATVTADGGVNEPSDDNGDDNDGKNPTLTPVDTGGGSGAGSPSGLAKSLNDSREAGSADPDVFIGEMVTWRVTFQAPAGLLRETTLTDTLPAGLTYMEGRTRLARNFDTGLSSSANPGGVNSASSGVFVGLIESSDFEVSGQTISLFLGNIINSDNDGNAESYTLELSALVENVPGNQAGVDLTNQAGLTFQNQLGQAASLTPVSDTITVIEPNLSITKSASPTAILESGGDVQFTLTVTNPSTGNTATAYDVNLTDALSAEWTGLSVDSVTPTGGVSSITDNTAGTTLDINAAVFPPDGQLVVVITATAAGPVAQGTLTNTSNVTWTSLPGDYGSGSGTPGEPGDADGERTGTGVGSNDYADSDTSDVVVGEVSLTKTILNPQTRYAIGDVVEYQVEITLPATVSLTNTVFTDVLDQGLTYETGTLGVVLESGLSAVSNPADFTRNDNTPGAGQETLTYDFGGLTNAQNAVRTITLTYDALVDNILGNQNNQTLSNNAAFDFDDPGGLGPAQVSDSQSMTVGEPNLTLSKTITSSTTGLDAGDTVDFQIVIGNTGTTTAFETIVTDTLPTGLENVTNLTVASATGGAETPVFINNGSDWESSEFDFPVGGSVTITFTATLSNTVIPGQQIQNSADADYTSQDGTDSNERDGSGGVNDYATSDTSAIITVDDPIAIDKAFYPDAANTTYTIGESFIYRVTVSIIEGAVNDVVVTDTLPNDVTFISAAVGVGNLGMSHSFVGPPVQVGQVLTFDFGAVSNPADGNSANDFLTMDILVRVDDAAGNVDGAVLGNNVTLDFTGAGGAETRVFDADLVAPGVQPLDLTIVEPDVQIVKTANPTITPPGDTVTFSILLDHTASSTADAFDLEVVDTLPAGLSYVPGSANITPVVSGQQLTFAVAALTLVDDQTTITFQATVDPDVTFGSPLTNTADLTYYSLSGNPNARSYTDSDDAVVTPDATSFIEAQKTVSIVVDGGAVGLANPGDTLEYVIVLENLGSDVTGVVFTDPVPTDTTYVAASLTTTSGTVDDSGNPNLAVNVGPMLSGATVTITFRVTIDPGTPAGTVISNQGLVDSEQTVPEPTDRDGVDGNGDQPTDITVDGPPALNSALHVQKVVEWVSDADVSGDVTAGDTMRYTFIFRNLGDEDLTNVTLSDVIPSGLTYVPASDFISAAGGLVTVIGQNLDVDIPALSIKGFEYASIDVTIDGPPLFDTDMDATIETFINQAVTGSDQTPPGMSDGDDNPANGEQPTQFTAVDGVSGFPVLDLEKRWSLAVDFDGDGLVDPNDIIEYVITLANTGSAVAENVVLNDDIPVNTTLVPGTVTTSQGIVITEDPVSVNLADLDPGAFATITFRVSINGGVPSGTIIENQATTSGDNTPDEPSDDNGDDDDGKNPTLTPVDTGANSGSPSGLDKTLISTSESGSAGSELLIGELATFQIEVALPAGLLREASLEDVLPAGLTYMPGTAELARVFDVGLTASQNPGGVNSAASTTFIPLADGSDIDITGQTITLFLGDIINSDGDGNEYYRLRYQALVDNVAGNQAATSLTNAATISWLNALSQPQSLTPVDATVTIIEPNLQVTKSASPITLLADGGDVVFTITVTNPDTGFTATGYDLQISDIFTAEWTAINVDSIAPSGGVIGVTDNTGAVSPLDVTVDVFPPDGQLVITLTATAPGPLALGSLSNTAGVTWTSLPGDFGTGSNTPGNPGDADGERTASGGVNDYTDTGATQVLVGQVNMDKSVENAQTRYAIGDTVDYRIETALPAGVSLANSGLTDVLDEGLTYVTGSLSVNYPTNVTSSLNPMEFTRNDDTPSAGFETLSLDFGTLANTTGATQTVVITYSALVDNIASNQNNQILDNDATLSFDNPGGSGTTDLMDAASITCGEPALTLVKTITSGVVGLDAGDTVDFQVTAQSTGNLTAYDVVLSDTLPAGLENITNLSVVSVSGGSDTPVLNNNGADWDTDPFNMPAGASVILEFTAQLAVAVIPGQQILNTVDGEFTSRSGADPNERDGSGGVNDYVTDADSQTITVADPIAIDKRFHPNPASDQYTIGDTVVYRVTASLIEGSVDDLVVTDVLPDGLRFESAVVGAGNMGVTHGYVGPPLETGQTLTFDFGDVSNPANLLTTDDFLTIDITATVENTAGNQHGTLLGNNASLSFTGAGGTETRDFDADPVAPGIQPLDLTVVLPELTISKDVDDVNAIPGQATTYTLTLAHTVDSGADAYDIVVTDTLPPELTYVNGSGSIAPVVVGNVLTFEVASLTLLDGQTTITYQALLDIDATVGAPVENVANAQFTTQPGDHPDERTGEDGTGGLNDLETPDANAVVIPTRPILTALKTDSHFADNDGDGNVSPGDELRYEVFIENTGNADATGVLFNDTPDANTSLVVGSVSTTQGSILAGNDGNPPVTVDLGTIPVGGNATVVFHVLVNTPLPAAVTEVSNQAVISSNELPDLTSDDPDPPGEDDPTVTPVTGTPVLSAVKTDSLAIDANNDGVVSPGDTVEYHITVTNSGNYSAVDVVFTDTPDGLTAIVPGSIVASQGAVTGGNGGTPPVEVELGEILGGGGFAEITFRVLIDNPFPTNTHQIVNQGEVSALDVDPVLTDDPDQPGSDDPTPTPVAQADLTVVKTANPGEIIAGLPFSYTLDVTNLGPDPATSVVLTDPLPVQVDFINATSPDGVCVYDPVTRTMTCELGNLAVSQTKSVQLEVLALDEGEITNAATVSAPEIDPDPNNNDDAAVVVGDPGVDLELSKSISPTNPGYFDIATYTLTLVNQGPDEATGIVVRDILPAGMSFVNASSNAGSYDNLTGLWSIDALGVSETAELNIQAQVLALGVIENIAEVIAIDQTDIDSTPDNGDPGEDDQDNAIINVDTLIDLALTKTVDPEVVANGEQAVFHIQLTNLGPSNATQVEVEDIMPLGLEFVEATASQGQYDPAMGIWTVGDLPRDQTITLDITVLAAGASNHPITNSATATALEPEADDTNNTDTATVTIITAVPTLTQWGLLAFVLTLMAAAIKLTRNRKTS